MEELNEEEKQLKAIMELSMQEQVEQQRAIEAEIARQNAMRNPKAAAMKKPQAAAMKKPQAAAMNVNIPRGAAIPLAAAPNSPY